MNDYIENYVTVLKKFSEFEGRSRRSEYWRFALVNFIIGVAFMLLSRIPGVWILEVLFCLAILLPSIAVTVRRLHDIGKPGLWILVGLIPFVGWIVLLVFAVQDSQPGSNQWGPNPKGA